MLRSVLRTWAGIKRGFLDLLGSIRLPRLFRLNWIGAFFGFIRESWQQGRVRNLLFGIPAIIIGLAASYLYLSTLTLPRSLPRDYWRNANVALAQKDYPKAQLMLNRVMQENRAHTVDARYALATMYEELGDDDRAAPLFRMLAPENKQGYKPAHQHLAYLLSSDLGMESTEEDLRSLQWHLKASGEDSSPRMAFAWGRYSLAIGNSESASKYFQQAAEDYPELWQVLGELETKFDHPKSAYENYVRASEYLGERIAESPANPEVRYNYVLVLARLGRFDDARRVHQQGYQFSDDKAAWNKNLAALLALHHDLLAKQKVGIPTLMSVLAEALSFDPNSAPALQRLMQYAQANVEGGGSLRPILATAIAEGKNPSLAHLAMGNVCWLEGDKESAQLHFDLAMSIQSDLAVVMNNMAWLLAHDKEQPDYDRALELVQKAIDQSPEKYNFLDTRGTIYLKRNAEGDLKRAALDLEKASKLITQRLMAKEGIAQKLISEKAEILGNLSKVYGGLGQKEVSEQFAIQSEVERQKAESAGRQR